MLEKLGKRAPAFPFVIALVVTLVLGTAIAPILNASPNEVPFAVVSLDKGATTFAGATNAGDTMVENLLAGESLGNTDAEDEDNPDQATIVWTELESEEQAREALANNEYYGALIIPEDFTSGQMIKMAGGNASELKVLLNKGRNPQMASAMQTNMSEMMLKAGVAVDIEMVNDADVGGGTMAEMMCVQMSVMPLFILSLIGSILTSLVFWHRKKLESRQDKAQVAARQAVYLLAVSAVISALVLCITVVGGGLTVPAGSMYLFLWICCYCLMLCITGLCDIALPLGALLGIIAFALGMGTAMLAPEMLPAFWRDWIAPWAPQAYMGNGLRQIIYFDAGPLNNCTPALLIYGGVGVVALLLAVVKPDREPKVDM